MLPARAHRANIPRLDRFGTLRRRYDLPPPNGGDSPPTPRKKRPAWLHMMHRKSDTSTRSRSPSMQPGVTPTARQREPLSPHVADASPSPLPVPKFLSLTTADIRTKFEDITWKERMRIQQGQSDPESAFAPLGIPATRVLDRYANVHPWTGNRVRLSVPNGKPDYINASPIKLRGTSTSKENLYIAMQGPKEASTDHVWRMIWHELASPAVIVMLTETHEAGQEKCHQYFPTSPDAEPLVVNERDEFEDGFKAIVRCEESTSTGLNNSIEARKLLMKVDGENEEKMIWHLLYKKWPDFGVPAGEDVSAFFETMKLSRTKNTVPSNPRIIHCSAGVGRSGTFIALEHLMDEVEAGNMKQLPDSRDPIFDTVNELRTQRPLMVQSEPQFQFLYQQTRKLWEAKYINGGAAALTSPVDDGPSDVFG